MSIDRNTEPLPRTEESLTPRIYIGLVISIVGFFTFVIGAKPAWFGWDRSLVVGFVQISVFLFGLALICLGGYISLHDLWARQERTIISEIGSRLVWTGYVIAVFAGLADIFGMGSQPFPNVPYFGPLQAAGVLIGQAIIGLGFLLLIPYRLPKTSR